MRCWGNWVSRCIKFICVKKKTGTLREIYQTDVSLPSINRTQANQFQLGRYDYSFFNMSMCISLLFYALARYCVDWVWWYHTCLFFGGCGLREMPSPIDPLATQARVISETIWVFLKLLTMVESTNLCTSASLLYCELSLCSKQFKVVLLGLPFWINVELE